MHKEMREICRILNPKRQNQKPYKALGGVKGEEGTEKGRGGRQEETIKILGIRKGQGTFKKQIV